MRGEFTGDLTKGSEENVFIWWRHHDVRFVWNFALSSLGPATVGCPKSGKSLLEKWKKQYDIIVASLAGNRLIYITYTIIIFYHLTIYCNTHSDSLWQCVVTRLLDSFDLRHFDTETHFPLSHSWYSWYQAAFHNLVEEPWTRYFNKSRPDFSAVEIRSWRKEFSLSMHCVIFCTFIFQQYIVSINTFA